MKKSKWRWHKGTSRRINFYYVLCSDKSFMASIGERDKTRLPLAYSTEGYFKRNQGRQPFIVIRRKVWVNAKPPEREALITHELLHILLGHTRRNPKELSQEQADKIIENLIPQAEFLIRNMCNRLMNKHILEWS